jgi:imidazole glycerol-phosphate synthase subunit HisH
MKKVIAIIDYGMGNVQSIKNMLNKFNVNTLLTKDKNRILQADAVILPGVGAFKKAMSELENNCLTEVINEYVITKKPILGVCLGMQLLFNSSEEFGMTKGLGLIDGRVVKFPSTVSGKLPHISWNKIKPKTIDWSNTMLKDISKKDSFYFVHSYICVPDDKSVILSATEYGGVEFCSAVVKNNIYGCQFHPEKSSVSGIALINGFLDKINDYR